MKMIVWFKDKAAHEDDGNVYSAYDTNILIATIQKGWLRCGGNQWCISSPIDEMNMRATCGEPTLKAAKHRVESQYKKVIGEKK
jgi:hypothetical protein